MRCLAKTARRPAPDRPRSGRRVLRGLDPRLRRGLPASTAAVTGSETGRDDGIAPPPRSTGRGPRIRPRVWQARRRTGRIARRLLIVPIAGLAVFLSSAWPGWRFAASRPGLSAARHWKAKEIASAETPDREVGGLAIRKKHPKRIERKLVIEWRSLRYRSRESPARNRLRLAEAAGPRARRHPLRPVLGRVLPPGRLSPSSETDAEDGWPKTSDPGRDRVEFVRIVGDSFQMGGIGGSRTMPDDPSYPAHPVTLSGFYIQTHEVTNGEFRRT